MTPSSIDTNEVLDPRSLLQRVADQALSLVKEADGVLIGLNDGTTVTFVTGSGFLRAHVGTTVALQSSLAGLALRSGEVVRSDDTQADDRVDAEACRRLGVASTVCVPLSRGGEALGIMAVSAKRPRAFGEEHVAALSRLAGFVGVAVGLAGDLARVQADLSLFSQPRPDDGLEEIAAAEQARLGAGRFVMSVLRPEAVSWMEGRRRVQAVLDNPDEISVVFQPIIALSSNRVVAVEALARFRALPTRPPDTWFAEADQVGLGPELEVLAVAKALAERHLLPGDVALTLNVGPAAFACDALHDLLYAARGTRLVVELTEHTSFDDYQAVLATRQRMRREGIELSVDDTGTGFSGLSHILKLAPDFIKLDRDLIRHVDIDPVRKALTSSLVAFAADTGAEIVAEGIETSDELEAVRALGVGYAQGYYLGMPGLLSAMSFDARSLAAAVPALWLGAPSGRAPVGLPGECGPPGGTNHPDLSQCRPTCR